MADWLWGLWFGRLIHGGDLDVPRNRRNGLIAGCNALDVPMIRIGVGWFGRAVGVVVFGAIADMSRDKAILAGTHDCRSWQRDVIGMAAAHEVSCQKDGRLGCGLGRVPTVIIAPPQHGQRSSSCLETASSAGAIIGAGVGTSSSFRHNASFAARWPLARKP